MANIDLLAVQKKVNQYAEREGLVPLAHPLADCSYPFFYSDNTKTSIRNNTELKDYPGILNSTSRVLTNN